MKKVRRISCLFILLAISYLGGFYTQTLYRHFYPHNIQQERSFEPLSQEIQPAVVKGDDTTNCDTAFVTLAYDSVLDETVQTQEAIPAKYIGMTREELEDELKDYALSPPLSELDKGLTSVELVSFAEEKIVLKKTYYMQIPEEGFVLVAERNYITVYCKDLETIYLYTDIRVDMLPLDIQQEILAKKNVESEAELYNFLESYSS